jgi:RNA polymerase sigma factor (sigma-70 family)
MARNAASPAKDSSPVGTCAERDDESLSTFQECALPLLDSLYNFAQWLTRNRVDAEDLVQETYLKAWRAFSSFKRGTNFRAWIFRILRNTFITSRSRLEQHRAVPLITGDNADLPASTARSTESRLIACADAHAIHRAIEQLPVIFREVILLSDVEEFTYREIAEALSVPVGTVMSRLARARQSIRDELEQSSGHRRRHLPESEGSRAYM